MWSPAWASVNTDSAVAACPLDTTSAPGEAEEGRLRPPARQSRQPNTCDCATAREPVAGGERRKRGASRADASPRPARASAAGDVGELLLAAAEERHHAAQLGADLLD